MSLTFPTIESPAFPIPVTTEDPALRSPFENGSEQTRPKFTRQRRVWTLNWPALSTADRNTLNAFFIETAGGSQSFTWTEPTADESVTGRFAEYKETQRTPDVWSVQIQIREL